MPTEIIIAYVPTPLNSLEAMCAALEVGTDVIKGWVRQGAPIAVEGEGNRRRYSAELARLLLWREQQTRRQAMR